MSSLKNTLTEAMKDAMRAKAKFRLGVIRMVLADIKRVEVDERIYNSPSNQSLTS